MLTSKLAAESYAVAYAACFGLEVLPFRFFDVFGLRSLPATPMPRSSRRSSRPRSQDGRCPVHGDGSQSRDFTYVESVAAMLRAAVLGRVSSTGPVNLAFGSHATLMDVVALLADLMAAPSMSRTWLRVRETSPISGRTPPGYGPSFRNCSPYLCRPVWRERCMVRRGPCPRAFHRGRVFV